MSTRSSVRRFVCIPILVAGLSLLLAGCGVNNIPSYEESAKAQWSQVLNQYGGLRIGLRQVAAFHC